LYTGEEVSVVEPAMRGMSNWNSRRLIEQIQARLRHRRGSPEADFVTLLIIKVVARLYDLVLNPGQDPADRAKNFFATNQLFQAALTFTNPAFLSMLGGIERTRNGVRPNVSAWANIVVENLVAKVASCERYGSESYDIELSFYNFANQFMGTAVLAQTIDVSDVVPVATGRVRAFSRR
jgi:hypothetical protein